MTRYQFEVLAWLERQGAGVYSLRGLSDTLAISGGEVSRCLDWLAGEKWITRQGDMLSVTEAGLAALEPYRVKRAVILAAGFGSRMMPATASSAAHKNRAGAFTPTRLAIICFSLYPNY